IQGRRRDRRRRAHHAGAGAKHRRRSGHLDSRSDADRRGGLASARRRLRDTVERTPRSQSLVGRYSFAEFVVSPRRRLLLRGDREIPLIPRYFDLLVFLIEHRHEAVHRREIFEGVWTDVIVSDSALSQAIRTIRRALGDDSREPRFIRTVSRHGYRFVFDPVTVLEDADDPPPQRSPASSGPVTPSALHGDPIELLLARLVSVPSTQTEEEEQREAAEVLHSLDTSTVLAQLG